MTELADIKRSIIENARARLPGIDEDNFHPDPPTGEYLRPCFYPAFREKKKSKDSPFGAQVHEYSFDITVETLEEDAATQDYDSVVFRTEMLEELFFGGEYLDFYQNGSARAMKMKVKTFRLAEGGVDRAKNRIKAELIIAF